MKRTLLLLITGIGLAALSASAASTVAYVQNNGTAYQTPALTGYTTLGDQMAGMDVYVTFSDGSVQHAVWGTTGSGAGAATAVGYFTISESGDTFNDNAWTLQNKSTSLSITSFRLFGAGDDTIFDRTFGGAEGTPGSASGKDFAMGGSYSLTATYSDILNLTGSPAVGDEWVQLQVDFASNTLFGPGSSVNFTQDADSAAVHGTITRVPDAGSTAMLLGFGLMGLAALKRRLH